MMRFDTGAVFQAGAILLLILESSAWVTGSASIHKSEVASLNGFIYTRLALLFLGPLMIKNMTRSRDSLMLTSKTCLNMGAATLISSTILNFRSDNYIVWQFTLLP